jgi:putative endonuclease
MERGGYVYILTNDRNKVLYTGVTSNINTRLYEHYHKENPNSFTAKNNVHKLVFLQSYETIEEAIAFEKYVKGKSRNFKIKLIQHKNPYWKNLKEVVMDWDS